MNVAHLLDAPAAEHPALLWAQGEMSYGDLRLQVADVADRLRREGVAAEDRIGVCADRSPAWIVGWLGVLSAGATYVPIDPMLPAQRRGQILEDLRPRLLLVEPQLRDLFDGSVKIVPLAAQATAGPAGRFAAPIHPLQAAYAIYTSGSTGAPKSVVVSHQSLSSYAAVLRGLLSLRPEDRYLHTASLAFSASMRQLLAPLASGATIVLASRDHVRDPMSLCALMQNARVSVLDTVPSYLARWLAVVLDAPAVQRAQVGASLRQVLTTGEPLPARTSRALRELWPAVRQVNIYGQTETTGTVAAHVVTTDVQDPVPIGDALAPTRFHVLRPTLAPAEAGEIGELYVSGPSLARGYDGRADLTAERFVPDPFSSEPGARLYRTGDRLRCLSDGRLEFVGRTDHQVKIHGVRIELGEVEAALATHPHVREVVAVVRKEEGADPRLVAYIVPASALSPSFQDFRTYLSQRLSDAAIPSAIVPVDAMPLTSTGKIDRPALAARDLPVSSEPVPEHAGTVLENLVAQCWREILRAPHVGADDDFFGLGGDSLQAVEMALRLQKRLPIQLPLLGLFFQDPTLSGFVRGIELEAGEEGLKAIERAASDRAAPQPSPAP